MDNRTNTRERRQYKVFEALCAGTQEFTAQGGINFLEGMRAQKDVPRCVSNIVSSKNGLSTFSQSMRTSTTNAFFNGQATQVLDYLRESADLKTTAGGNILRVILKAIVDPPIFWNAFKYAFLNDELCDSAQCAFGWLLLELCSLPPEEASPYTSSDNIDSILNKLVKSTHGPTHSFGAKLKHVLSTRASPIIEEKYGPGPGGRHDNDFADFRQIAILPTMDELCFTGKPFLRPSSFLTDPETEPRRIANHLDNQFRLLREDMMYELREEHQLATGKKKGSSRGIKIDSLSIVGIDCGPAGPKRTKWNLVLESTHPFPRMEKKNERERQSYLEDRKNIFKHMSSVCLISGKDTVISFPWVNRKEDLLAKKNAQVVLQVEGKDNVAQTFRHFKRQAEKISLTEVNTGIFAYDPILKALQQAATLPLSSELLSWSEGMPVGRVVDSDRAEPLVDALLSNPGQNLRPLLGAKSNIVLDKTQSMSLLTGLTQAVSLIQGPPGTGKSFIGALIAKGIYLFTGRTILVVCYTNHALDDILEGLLGIGIPESDMLRLGNKHTPKTEPLLLSRQPTRNRTRTQWNVIDSMKAIVEERHDVFADAFSKYQRFSPGLLDVLEYVEFNAEEYFEAFRVPESEDGMVRVGRNNREVDETYLIDRWISGRNPGIFSSSPRSRRSIEIWKMSKAQRQQQWDKWRDALLDEVVDELATQGPKYNESVEQLMTAQNTSLEGILQSKRVVGCTTTAAAKYWENIRTFNPNVLLVEEAGEILESHILTALGPNTTQLVLIGDHKQLRPKVNNYELTKEKGDGFDLNVSLFERLIVLGYPHAQLSQQHRMRPEISALIRHLTYPELVDADSTKSRPNIDGLRDNIIFIDHDYLEDIFTGIGDKRDEASPTSKQNTQEVLMILKTVRYLGQQGYGTDNIVILTPYLGQLYRLRDELRADNDPVLNDLDSFDLVKAGLVTPTQAGAAKKRIRLATIDNYQGEESDIVIASMTRSNPNGDIGFMFAPERLNVLLSRARNGLILIGNAKTFREARNPAGRQLWRTLFELLAGGNHMYDGLPVKCERHPDRVATLRTPDDFDLLCPDGGCSEPCGATLSCPAGHPCPSKCHQIVDHSKMPCLVTDSWTCPVGHVRKFVCRDGPPHECPKCARDQRLEKERKSREIREQLLREEEQRKHLARLDKLNEEIEAEKRWVEDEEHRKAQENAIKQKETDLAALRALRRPQLPTTTPQPAPVSPAMPAAPIVTTGTPGPFTDLPVSQCSSIQADLDGSDPTPNIPDGSDGPAVTLAVLPGGSVPPSAVPAKLSIGDPPAPKPFPAIRPSASSSEWFRQKMFEGASNPAIDAIMAMTGLEDIKRQVLAIKAKVDTSIRQGASLKQDRFNVVLLGNPGTGKTTVARQYAKFLASVKVIPTETFIETTGSRLANEGVDTVKKTLEAMVKGGGGTFFVDEAYQLTSGHNTGGGAVLDFLLAEMENQVGKIVFILAGYNREMEKFFEHNPGLNSRVPYQFQFADYKDEELLEIFKAAVKQTFGGRMKIEGGENGLYMRIMIRRLGRRRGTSGFGNARDVQGMLSKVRERQSERLTGLRAKGDRGDDLFFSSTDLIGPDPVTAMKEIKAWGRLQAMIGLKSVKESVRGFFTLIQENYQRELLEQEPMHVPLNRVFLGSPGTGKTTVAKLYGEILAGLGLLSNGEVIVKNPSDFIGAVLGASEANTKGILSNAVGKVLIIDEAYMLYGGGGEGGNHSNQFKTTVIDTIVAEVQSVPGEDRCVLLLGYKEQMEEMFQNVNPGLARRFKIEDAFAFDDFDDDELLKILELKLKDQDLDATDEAKKVAMRLLNRRRNRPNFGNAGDVENMISEAKTRCVARRAKLADKPLMVTFEPEDIEPDHDRAANAAANLEKLFEDIVGHRGLVEQLRGYQQLAAKCLERDWKASEHVPTNFVFTGPPGTGKTTVARKIGQVYYDMGILGSTEVVEASASDLVGQYVGHTGPKTKKLFEKALGRVLFIDEAYRLADGMFGQEAVDELVGLMTQANFKGKLVIVLAGYEDDMNRLMSVNAGLSSRFPEQVFFANMDGESCLEVVRKELEKKGVVCHALMDTECSTYRRLKGVVDDLAELPNWGNARDMVTLAGEMVRRAVLEDDNAGGGKIILSEETAMSVAEKMLTERERRTGGMPVQPRVRGRKGKLPVATSTAEGPTPPPTSTETSTKVEKPKTPETKASTGPAGDGRDAGVDDATWNALQAAIREQKEIEEKRKREIKTFDKKRKAEKAREEKEASERKRLEEAERQERDNNRRAQLAQQKEAARLREHAARMARQRAEQELAERRRAEQQEKANQQKLRKLGRCVAGFQWIRMGNHYRCAGGSHLVSLDELK